MREDSGCDEGVWEILAYPPITGYWRHLSGGLGTFSQRKIPPCRIGRVSKRSCQQQADVTGATTLHNVSPVGEWIVEAVRIPEHRNLLGKVPLEDIDLRAVCTIHDLFRCRDRAGVLEDPFHPRALCAILGMH